MYFYFCLQYCPNYQQSEAIKQSYPAITSMNHDNYQSDKACNNKKWHLRVNGSQQLSNYT